MADRRERFEDPVEAVRVAFEGMQAALWTALPGIVESFDAAAGTIRVTPAIKARVFSPNDEPPLPGAVFDADNWWTVNLPLIVDVPVCFGGGGQFVLTFPIQPGDECLLVFCCRSFDNWWVQGGIQKQSISALHDLSDAIAIFGPRSKPRALTNVNTTNAELRSEDGTVKIELTGSDVNITASGKVTLNAPEVDISNGGALKALLNEGFKTLYDGHIHPVGAGFSGGPTVPIPPTDLTTVLKAE